MGGRGQERIRSLLRSLLWQIIIAGVKRAAPHMVGLSKGVILHSRCVAVGNPHGSERVGQAAEKN